MTNPQPISFSSTKIEIIKSILKKLEGNKKKKEFRIISFNEFFSFLNTSENDFITKLLKIKLLDFGFKGKYYGFQEVPDDLIEIPDQQYKINHEIKKIETQYLPKKVYNAYMKLNQSLYMDKNKTLLILSGYRSPAYQLFVFLWYLKYYKFDFAKTIKRAAIPGYSEHSFSEKQAIDFITEDGSPTEENPTDFEKTTEYQWLLKNANRFHFYETNPRNNTLGTMFEPWHWSYMK